MELCDYFFQYRQVYSNGIAAELRLSELFEIELDWIQDISKQCSLEFVWTKNRDGNLCMAQNDDLRPEFRQSFSALNALNYCYSLQINRAFNNGTGSSFYLPKNKEAFWTLESLGAQLKEIHSLKKKENETTVFESEPSSSVYCGTFCFERDNHGQEGLGSICIEGVSYWGQLPEKVWTFGLANQQPVQKWLQLRRGAQITLEECERFKMILLALKQSLKLLQNAPLLGGY